MKDVSFFNDHISIKIKHSKTDQFNKGADVCIAKTETRLCPVSWLNKYIVSAGLKMYSDQYLFTKIRFCKKQASYTLVDTSTPLSYTRAREIFLEALDVIGEDKRLYGLHSLRSGEASAFVNGECGNDVLLLNKHGRWKSSTLSTGYCT